MSVIIWSPQRWIGCYGSPSNLFLPQVLPPPPNPTHHRVSSFSLSDWGLTASSWNVSKWHLNLKAQGHWGCHSCDKWLYNKQSTHKRKTYHLHQRTGFGCKWRFVGSASSDAAGYCSSNYVLSRSVGGIHISTLTLSLSLSCSLSLSHSLSLSLSLSSSHTYYVGGIDGDSHCLL